MPKKARAHTTPEGPMMYILTRAVMYIYTDPQWCWGVIMMGVGVLGHFLFVHKTMDDGGAGTSAPMYVGAPPAYFAHTHDSALHESSFFQHNQVDGTIPTELGRLTALKRL